MDMAKKQQVEVVAQGDRIIIPEGMEPKTAMVWLERKQHEEEQVVRVRELIEGYPFDAAHAFAKALQLKFGWVGLTSTPGFFASTPPMMIGLDVGGGNTVQVPWGRMQIPGIEGFLQTSIETKGDQLVFAITGEVRQKSRAAVVEIARLAREALKTESVYKGKAIRVSFDNTDEDGEPTFDINQSPKFLELDRVDESELVFSEDTRQQLNASLFTLVERTEECRKHLIPLKRGILLEGPYGCGKTLTAYVAAKKCVQNGWTFIYIDKMAELQPALAFAAQYQPAMIFAEDLDRTMEGEKRDADMDGVLNTIDGIESKGTEIVVVLTTNHVERINQAMLRPGRLDAVVSVQPPDAAAVARLIKMYGRGLVQLDENLDLVASMLRGQIPAVIREVVERAKLSAIARGTGEQLKLVAGDLQEAAAGMLAHLRLLKPKEADKRTNGEKFADALGKHLLNAVNTARGETPALEAGNGNGKSHWDGLGSDAV